MNKNDGGSAYAKIVVPEKASGVHTDHPGMSQRDWFAGMALQALVKQSWDHMDDVAIEAYGLADAMLKAREGEG